MSVVVLCPMSIEHKAVSRELRRAGLSRMPVVQTGIGREAIVRAFEREFARHGTGALYVLAGACGGLRATDDVPPIAGVIDEHGRCRRPFGAADEHAGVTLVGVDRIVATPADKRALAEATGAAIVDMETHAFAAACEQRGAAWSVVRGVSDTPEQTLPPEVLGWVTPEGGTRGARAAADLARKPSLLPHVVGVVRRANRVLPKVGERVAALARAWMERCAAAPSSRGWASGPCTAPIPIGADATAAIFFGGTFDPPHVGHVELPRRVRAWYEQRFDARGTAWLVYVPAARSPHKDERPVASGAERVAMLRAALGEGGEAGGPVERAVVWEDELGRGDAGPSYTVDTMERARAWLDAHGRVGVRMRLLIGADQAAQFHRWRSARRVMELAEPLVMAREGDAGAALSALRESGFWTADELEAWRGRIVPVGTVEASSTAVRAALREGRSADAARVLPASVARYIEERGLYRR
jgi:nicotinate-nucleotide adenylyltransferase